MAMLHHNIDALVDAGIHYTSFASRPIIIGVKPRSFCSGLKRGIRLPCDTNFYKAHHALWFCNVCGFSLANLSKYAKSSVLIALVDIQF
jgi:hypothetical protein